MIRFASKPTSLLLAGLVLLAGGPAVRAQPPRSATQTVVGQLPEDGTDVRVEQVAVAAGELASPGGRDRVMRRVERAVRHVCGVDDTGSLSERTAYEACHDTSLADATAQMTVLVARNGIGAVQIADAGGR